MSGESQHRALRFMVKVLAAALYELAQPSLACLEVGFVSKAEGSFLDIAVPDGDLVDPFALKPVPECYLHTEVNHLPSTTGASIYSFNLPSTDVLGGNAQFATEL